MTMWFHFVCTNKNNFKLIYKETTHSMLGEQETKNKSLSNIVVKWSTLLKLITRNIKHRESEMKVKKGWYWQEKELKKGKKPQVIKVVVDREECPTLQDCIVQKAKQKKKLYKIALCNY